jgi:hypothetical protein
VTWDLLVLMWQVIGRLVRGGVPARVVFTDAAFAPRWAQYQYEMRHPEAEATLLPDDAKSSLLVSIADQLDRYCAPRTAQDLALPTDDRKIVSELYGPMWRALKACLAELTTEDSNG